MKASASATASSAMSSAAACCCIWSTAPARTPARPTGPCAPSSKPMATASTDKPEIVALTKADALTPEQLKEQVARLKTRREENAAGAVRASRAGRAGGVARAAQVIDGDARESAASSRRPRPSGSRNSCRARPLASPISAASSSRSARRCWSIPRPGACARTGSPRSPTTSPRLHKDKRDILVVSSGAIALGRAVLKLPRGPLKLEDSQAAAAVGQIALARTWAEALGQHGIAAGQILLTLERHRGAPPLSQRALDHRQAAGMAHACR